MVALVMIICRTVLDLFLVFFFFRCSCEFCLIDLGAS
jgi:hypothetical protein